MRSAIVIGIMVLIGGALVFAVMNQSESDEAELTYQTVQDDLAAGAKLYDVRTDEEYVAGHIAEAELFSLQTIQAGTLPDDELDTKLYVYCRSGNRSAQATALLEAAGYTNIVDLGAMTSVASLGGEIIEE